MGAKNFQMVKRKYKLKSLIKQKGRPKRSGGEEDQSAKKLSHPIFPHFPFPLPPTFPSPNHFRMLSWPGNGREHHLPDDPPLGLMFSLLTERETTYKKRGPQ